MFLDSLEPATAEEFDFIKEQLGLWNPILLNMEYGKGKLLDQVVKFTGLPKEELEKVILGSAEEAVTKQMKINLMYSRLSLPRSAEQLEEITNIPMRKLERSYLRRAGTFVFLFALREALLMGGVLFLLFMSKIPALYVILMGFGYLGYTVIKTIASEHHPVVSRILNGVLKAIGRGDTRWIS